jgi:hypothetical protein
MSIKNHAKAFDAEYADVLFFNNTNAAVSLKKGELLCYDPAVETSASAEIEAGDLPTRISAEPTDSLPASIRARIVIKAINGDYDAAGVCAEAHASIAADSGKWIRIILPGSVAPLYTKDNDILLGSRLTWDVSIGAFVLRAGATTTSLIGGGSARSLEAGSTGTTAACLMGKILVGDTATGAVSA